MAGSSARSAKGLYIQVLLGVVLGAALGYFWPALAVRMQPFGDAFIKLVRMIIAPIVFVTVVVGIAKLSDAREVGRIGIKAIVYFELMTTIAMFIGLVVAHVIQPGAGLNIDPATLDSKSIATYVNAPHLDVVSFLLNIIPNTVADAFAKGEILQVLLFAVLFGLGLSRMGDHGKAVVHFLDETGGALFGVIAIIMRAAPLGAFGAMAFTIGRYGIGALAQLGFLMLCFYLTCVLFIFLAMGAVAALMGLNILKILRFVKEEFLIGTRYFLVRGGNAYTDGKAGAAGLRQVPGRPDRAAGVCVQPGRVVDLFHHGHRLHRSGAEYPAELGRLFAHSVGPAVDVEGRGHRDRRWIYHPGRDARHDEREGAGRGHGPGAGD